MGSAGVAQSVEHFIGNEEVHEFDSHHQLHKKPHSDAVFYFLCELSRELPCRIELKYSSILLSIFSRSSLKVC